MKKKKKKIDAQGLTILTFQLKHFQNFLPGFLAVEEIFDIMHPRPHGHFETHSNFRPRDDHDLLVDDSIVIEVSLSNDS